jgi:formylmethanofuran dehydrogenase subunit E
MFILKILLFAFPVIFFLIFLYLKSKINNAINSNQNKEISKQIIECEKCGVFVDQDLLVKKNKKFYCSENCSNP